jgi:hypothetical protein
VKALLDEKLLGRFLDPTLFFFNYLMTEFGHESTQKTNARILFLSARLSSKECCLPPKSASERRPGAVGLAIPEG